MSVDDLKGFVAKLEADTALWDEARSLEGLPDRADRLCRLAAENGFDVTVDDWADAAAGAGVASLDDASLDAVVGGGCYISMGGLISTHQPTD